MRCSGSHGPTVRMNRPAALLTLTRSRRRTKRSSPPTNAPAALSAAGCNAVSRRRRRRRIPLISAGARSKVDNDFAKDLPALEPLEALLDVREGKLAVDDGRYTVGHFGKARADIAQGCAERTEDLVLLLEQLHQIECDGGARRGATGD